MVGRVTTASLSVSEIKGTACLGVTEVARQVESRIPTTWYCKATILLDAILLDADSQQASLYEEASRKER